MALAGGKDLLACSQILGVLKLAGYSHRSGEIIRTNEYGINSRDSQDFINILYCVDVLDLDRRKDFVICGREFLFDSQTEAICTTETDAPSTLWRILHRGNEQFCFSTSIYERANDTESAGIDVAFYQRVIDAMQPNHRGAIGIPGGDCLEQLLCLW